MAEGWILQAIFSALLSQGMISSNSQPSTTTARVPTTVVSSPSGVGDSAMLYRPEIPTGHGTFKGVRRKTPSANRFVDTFLGIPYARPPVGQLRFEKPHPMPASKGTRDASTFGNECHQMSFPGYSPPHIGDASLLQDEDCLYLNIYKPVTGNSPYTLLSVMVWIHGGGYVLGAGSQYDGSNLALRGVIVVTINYRLDVLGFLSSENDAIPGNYGMLDQVLALQWVKENIVAFGGDPDLVTIFGESAGASSVSLLLVSPLSNGLFQRAIMESGSSLSPWAVNRPLTRITPSQIVSLVGRDVGCTETDKMKMLACLRDVSVYVLKNASVSVATLFDYEVTVAPVVERAFGFLPDLPIKLWTQNKFNHVDTIRGFNQAENGELFGTDFSNFTKVTFTENLQQIFKPYAIFDTEKLVKQMLEAYVGNETRPKNILLDLIEASSDFEFVGPTLVETNIELKMAPEKKHFVYQFAHKSGLSSNPPWIPATHQEEIPFVFGVKLKEFHTNGKSSSLADESVSDQLQELWSNFAKYGEPTRMIPNGAVKWETYGCDDDAKVLKITNSSKMVPFKNSAAVYFTSHILKNLDSSLHGDGHLVG